MYSNHLLPAVFSESDLKVGLIVKAKWIPMQEQHKNKRKTTSAPILAMQC
jgi:hypothetical protein